MQITINETDIFFQVQYSKRSKMTLEATPEGHITVKAPSKSTESDIMNFMKSNSKILLAFQKQIESRKYISSQKQYTADETFLYLGKACTLNDLLEDIPESEALIQLALKKFYTQKTKQIVKKRVNHYEKLIGVKAKSITIVDSPKSWGTCNGLKELTFNYRLSMAPPAVIDYVVIHELCHILHLNHDRSFWRKVGAYDHNYEEKEAYLRRFGGVMTV